MNHKKVSFTNNEGQELSGYLELPLNQEPHNFVLFAHCFTCNKNFFAVKNISQALRSNGFGILRFDFTGLGESEGDFSDTNFSGNVEDILAAARYLEQEHKSPSLLIGHSLGGAAVIFAAQELPSVLAVATIGAPSSPTHVTRLLKSEMAEIRKKGLATVNLGGRDFTIKEQFLEDLETNQLEEVVQEFDKAFLVLHSPQDFVVGINNAEELYQAARHPKSFVSLDGADHLLTQKEDSQYTGKVIAAWAGKYLSVPEAEIPRTKHQVVANLGAEGFTTQLKAGNHYLTADEPRSVGGNDFGPTPYDLISAALAACTSMTIQMYARRKEWALTNVETHVNYFKKHADDCTDCSSDSAKIDFFERFVVIEGELDEKQRERILQIADRCPVHRTLHEKVKITTQMQDLSD